MNTFMVVIKTKNGILKDEKNQYDCSKCNYRDRSINFCGFCTKKLLKEIKEAKDERKKNNFSAENESAE